MHARYSTVNIQAYLSIPTRISRTRFHLAANRLANVYSLLLSTLFYPLRTRDPNFGKMSKTVETG